AAGARAGLTPLVHAADVAVVARRAVRLHDVSARAVRPARVQRAGIAIVAVDTDALLGRDETGEQRRAPAARGIEPGRRRAGTDRAGLDVDERADAARRLTATRIREELAERASHHLRGDSGGDRGRELRPTRAAPFRAMPDVRVPRVERARERGQERT